MASTEQQDLTQADRLRVEHEKLVTEAARQPGVAEVLEVYGRVAPYAPTPTWARPPTRYATGGNG